jgi:hypothetical protein
MNQRTQFKISANGDELHVKIIGVIDEDINFTAINPGNCKKILFDFQDCELINSCGIREWIQFLGKLPKNLAIEYANCPQIIIEQVNMVKGFITANARVKSFYAPYFCETCDKEHAVLIESSQIKNMKAPEIKCPTCQYVMDFDAIATQYFHFLTNG